MNFLGPSPKRTLISRQNLIKTKSPVIIYFHTTDESCQPYGSNYRMTRTNQTVVVFCRQKKLE
jgi:hypothetical protein